LSRIESNIAEINNSPEKVFNFLSDMNNFGKLMPEQVINWKSTVDNCSFTIKGMTDLSMKISEKTPNTKVVYIPDGKVPFNFSLNINLQNPKENLCIAQIIFDAELNAMMEMLASKPLQNFVNMLAAKLKELGDKL